MPFASLFLLVRRTQVALFVQLTKLLALKADYKSMTGEDYVAPGQV